MVGPERQDMPCSAWWRMVEEKVGLTMRTRLVSGQVVLSLSQVKEGKRAYLTPTWSRLG